MKTVRDPAVVATIEDEAMRELLARRFAEIQIDGLPYDPETYGWFLVLTPGDDLSTVAASEGCPPLFLPDSGDPVFEWVVDRGFCFEAIVLLSDGGDFISVLVPKQAGMDARLLAVCEAQAEEAV